MAVTAKIFPLGIVRAYWGQIDVNTNPIKCALLTSAYSPNQQSDQAWSVISANEVSGTGYTAGGKTLSDVTVGLKTGTTTFQCWASECSWPDSTITARYAVIYDATTSCLLSYIDFGENKSSVDGLFKVDFNDADGVFYITT